MFHPGETIAHRFIIPFVASEVAKVIVTYKQDDHVILIKSITSGFEQGSSQAEAVFTVTLSQTESLLFEEYQDYKIQLNVINTSGGRAASKEMKGTNGAQHYKKVISSG